MSAHRAWQVGKWLVFMEWGITLTWWAVGVRWWGGLILYLGPLRLSLWCKNNTNLAGINKGISDENTAGTESGLSYTSVNNTTTSKGVKP